MSAFTCFYFLSTFILVSFATCGDGVIDGTEDCDGGLHCTGCACDAGFEPTSSPSLFCVEDCYNPVNPLESLEPSSSITVLLVSGAVDFHAIIDHQSTDVTSLVPGGSVLETQVTFGNSGTVCDYPDNTMLVPTLNTLACVDDIGKNAIQFSAFSPCLVQTCSDVSDNVVDCTNPATCTQPPCIMQWGSPVTITRTFNVQNTNGDVFNRTTTSGHNLLFSFPWIQSAGVNVAIWSTPDTTASAAITSISYAATTDKWTVVVTVSMNWPYRLTAPVNSAINGFLYTVSACTAVQGNDCVQTITFIVPGCTSIHSAFGGISNTYNGLKYECADMASPDCPLAAGTSRDATLSIKIDTEGDCSVVDSDTTITSGDVSFDLIQPGFVGARGSFVDGDVIDFLFSVNATLTTAAVSDISVVSLRETIFGSGTNLVTSTTTSGNVCSNANNLCISLDTTQLQGTPSAAKSNLHFLITVEIQFTGISKKKRAVFSASSVPLSASAAAIMEQESDLGSLAPALVPFTLCLAVLVQIANFVV